MDRKQLFLEMYAAKTESELDAVLAQYPATADPGNWHAYGDNESNFGVVENQQASPIPALVEKLINSIDAMLMRRCLEAGMDPRSIGAPQSMQDAVSRFFPNARSWDLSAERKRQAECIQIVADGPRGDTSLTIYDDGEGQHPADFPTTFLSLLRGNKNEIHFVQGKYNMGGAGAIAFCGKKRYQLVASKRYDESGLFGFTLVRRHPVSLAERTNRKNTWYEYLVLDDQIPAFAIDQLDLGLYGRRFTTGTIIKLYSYDLPAGARSVISRDLNQSINEHLFSPALPLYTIDKPERYPKDRNLQRELYGLQRRLEEDGEKYIAEFFSDTLTDHAMGRVKITCYVFRPTLADKSARESKESIQREFFKNNMAVIFSVHGQVHGHYTSEFITRSLKLPLLKDYLLVHVDCTDMQLEFRNELFMASRDRLKDGEESRTLRHNLADILLKGRLSEIHDARKNAISVESKDADDLLRSFTRDLPLQSELVRLLSQTFKLRDGSGGGPSKADKARRQRTSKREDPVFHPQRFPSFFKLQKTLRGGTSILKVPLGGDRTIKFSTDAEDQYFDRVSEPGDLKIAVLGVETNTANGGTKPGLPKQPDDLLNVVRSSPHRGTIRVVVSPTDEARVGDAVRIRAQLSGPGATFEEIILVNITDPEAKQPKSEPGNDEPERPLGLPRLALVYRDVGKGPITWADLEQQGIDIDHNVVMHPLVDGDLLTTIYVNMDSRVLLKHRSKLSAEASITLGERRYISSVYFHTLFLYMITRNRQYEIVRPRSDAVVPESIDLTEYLKDVFQSYYAEFLLNFEVQQLLAALE